MGKKVFKLETILDVQGRNFTGPERDKEGKVVREIARDAEGKPVMQVPRDQKGNPIPGVEPEPVYQIKTKKLEKDSFPELLKGLYLNIPGDLLTRQDTIYGTRMFQNIAAMKDGVLELDDDIHDWIKEKLKDDKIGIKIFGVDLYVVENAVDNFLRPHEPQSKKK
jgi:hypothetical protein